MPRLARRPNSNDDASPVTSVYKTSDGQHAIRRWCTETLARAGFPLTTAVVESRAGAVALTTAGTRRPRVMFVPGTGFNAAAAVPWLRALSRHWTTTVVDLPGQPGLSAPDRPRHERLAWYARVLDDVLTTTDAEDVVVVGNSLGAAVALAADSPRIAGRVLISPAGIIRLGLDPELALASAVWLLRPTPERTRRMLRLFVPPGTTPPDLDVEWMTLMATHCRTTLAPPSLPAALLARRAQHPCVIAVGEHDRFLPPHRLTPAVRHTMNLDTIVLPDVGHLTTPAHLDKILPLVAHIAGRP